MSDFQLGQRVAYTEHLKRRHAGPGEFLGPHKIWSNNWGPSYRADHRWSGGEGVIVGKRTLSNGNVTRGYYDGGGDEYVPSEHFTAYLIAYDLRRKPVHVRPEHITALPDKEPDHCPYDCDGCHDETCPCDRMGCAGSEEGALL